jgi:hypothetical protein
MCNYELSIQYIRYIQYRYGVCLYGATFDRAEFALGSGLDRKNGNGNSFC